VPLLHAVLDTHRTGHMNLPIAAKLVRVVTMEGVSAAANPNVMALHAYMQKLMMKM
jgi:hypothetical protein